MFKWYSHIEKKYQCKLICFLLDLQNGDSVSPEIHFVGLENCPLKVKKNQSFITKLTYLFGLHTNVKFAKMMPNNKDDVKYFFPNLI